MSRVNYANWAVDTNGDVVPGASVEVRVPGGALITTLTTDQAGTVPLVNPFTADGDGRFEFWALPGQYEITVGVTPTAAVIPVTLALEVMEIDANSNAVQRIPARRNAATYPNAALIFDGPRSDTADGGTVTGRGMVMLQGNSADQTASMWISAQSASLVPSNVDATMQGYQSGVEVDSSGVVRFWFNGTEAFSATTTSALVGGKIAAHVATTGVGAVALARPAVLASYSYGDTIAGSGLRISNAAGGNVGQTPSGTWRCLGISEGTTNENSTTLWGRIA